MDPFLQTGKPGAHQSPAAKEACAQDARPHTRSLKGLDADTGSHARWAGGPQVCSGTLLSLKPHLQDTRV